MKIQNIDAERRAKSCAHSYIDGAVVAARRGNMSIHTTHSPGKFQLAHIKPIFSEIGNPPNILSTQPRSLLWL